MYKTVTFNQGHAQGYSQENPQLFTFVRLEPPGYWHALSAEHVVSEIIKVEHHSWLEAVNNNKKKTNQKETSHFSPYFSMLLLFAFRPAWCGQHNNYGTSTSRGHTTAGGTPEFRYYLVVSTTSLVIRT
jgi:hypothetical protein